MIRYETPITSVLILKPLPKYIVWTPRPPLNPMIRYETPITSVLILKPLPKYIVWTPTNAILHGQAKSTYDIRLVTIAGILAVRKNQTAVKTQLHRAKL